MYETVSQVLKVKELEILCLSLCREQTMELSINALNFEDGEEHREINSPRTLEACLRVGVDPSELDAKERGEFFAKGLNKDMVSMKYQSYERKRLEKIEDVKKERDSIINFAVKKSMSQPNSPSKLPAIEENDTAGGLVEQVSSYMRMGGSMTLIFGFCTFNHISSIMRKDIELT